VTEDRSERAPPSRLGLWRCSLLISQQSGILERLGLWRCSLSIRYPRRTNEPSGLRKRFSRILDQL